MENSLEYKLELLPIVYGDAGRLTHIKDEIYAFVYTDNKMKLINVENNIKITENKYILEYLGDNIIVLNNISSTLKIESVILDRKTFKIIHKSNKLIKVTKDLVFEENEVALNNNYCNREIFNLSGQSLLHIEGGNEFSISITDNENYYIASYKEEEEEAQYRTYNILYYNKENSTLESKWTGDKYIIDCIGFGLLMFSDKTNFKKVKIVDILNEIVID